MSCSRVISCICWCKDGAPLIGLTAPPVFEATVLLSLQRENNCSSLLLNTTAPSEIQSCRCISNVVREEPGYPSWSCHLFSCLLTQIDCTFLKFLPLMVASEQAVMLNLCPGACHLPVLTSLQLSDIPLLCSSW